MGHIRAFLGLIYAKNKLKTHIKNRYTKGILGPILG